MKLSSVDNFIEDRPESVLYAQPATMVSNGPVVCNLSDMTDRSTKAFPGVPAYLLEISDGECIWPNILVSSETLIDSNNGYGSLEMVGHSENDQALRVTSGGGKLRFRLVDKQERTDMIEPFGILVAAANYSSWILGELPRISLYKKISPTPKIILHGVAKPYHLQSLGAFGIKSDQIVVVDKQSSVAGKTFYYATPTFMHQNMSFESIGLLRDQLFSEHKNDAKAGTSIYVSRSKLGAIHDRRIRNEAEVESYLTDNGFEIIHPQELSFLQQAQAFSSARRIVAPFGAALANAVFCRKDVRPCIIQTKHTPEFDRLFQWLGADVFHLTPRREKVRNATFQSQAFEFAVNLDNLRKFVQATE